MCDRIKEMIITKAHNFYFKFKQNQKQCYS